MSLTIPVKELFEAREGLTSKHSTWEEIELKNGVRVQNGFPFESSLFNANKNGEPLIRIRDILNNKSDTYYSGKYDSEFIVKKGDLLIGMDGDFNSAIWNGENGLLNQRVCRLIVDESVLLKKFVYYGIGGYLKKINEYTSSVTVKHLSSNSIKEIPFPLPPLAEQKRIVEKLDTLFEHLDQLKARLQNISTLLKQFRQTVLTQAVLVDGKKRSFSNYIEIINGFAFKSSDYTESGIPLMKISNVGYGEVIDKDQKFLPKIYSDRYKSFLIIKGDLLMPMTRPITNGELKITFYDREEVALLNQRVSIIRSKTSDLKFVFYLLQTTELKQEISKNFNETLQPNLSPKDLLDLEVYLPPLKEQKEIVKRVELLLSLADRIEANCRALQEKIDQLPQAILSRAFKGKLVEQDPNDGSATDIIENIKVNITKAKQAPQKEPKTKLPKNSARKSKQDVVQSDRIKHLSDIPLTSVLKKNFGKKPFESKDLEKLNTDYNVLKNQLFEMLDLSMHLNKGLRLTMEISKKGMKFKFSES